jgi:sulfite oxidase
MHHEMTTVPSGKHPSLIVRQQEPFNAGPPPEFQGREMLTPNDLFFVRNHGSVPAVDPADYRFQVTGLVERPLSLSLEDLKRDFSKEQVMAVVQCAGDRRAELAAVQPIPGEVPWGIEAASNALWGGIALSDVLEAAGVYDDALQVAFSGLDEVQRDGKNVGFGGSIPIEKAMGGEVILAYEMNGEPLPLLHGAPLRAIVPGYIGARSVKWLRAVEVRYMPSDNYFQAHAYKLFPPDTRPETADWDKAPMLGDLVLNAVITQPREGERIPHQGRHTVKGYAIAGASGRVVWLEVSPDGGKTWMTADTVEQPTPWSWCLWEAEVDLPPGPRQIVVRAWDAEGKSQPEDLRAVWNFKGYMNNAWHRVNVHVG